MFPSNPFVEKYKMVLNNLANNINTNTHGLNTF